MLQLICRFFQWIRRLFWSKEMDITVVGLQQAGKTTFVNVIADSQYVEDTIPTIGFNMRLIKKGKVVMKVWDLGGERRFRGMWERYCRGINAIVYVVDAANKDKLQESKDELLYLLSKPQLAHIPVIVLGNKTDLPNAISKTELIKQMSLSDIENREVCFYMISCRNKENIDLTLQWLINHSRYPQ